MPGLSHAPRRHRRRWLPREVRWGLTALAIGVIGYFLLPEVSGARRALNQIAKVNVVYLGAGVLLEAAALMAYAELTRTVLPSHSIKRSRLLRIDLSSLAVSHVVPGGTAPGTGVAYRLLTDTGIPGADAGFALAMQGAGSAVVLNALLWVALLVSLFLHGFNPLYGVAAGIGVLLMAAFGGVVILLLRGRRWAVDMVRRVADRLPLLNGDTVARVVEDVANRLQTLISQPVLLRRAAVWAAANWLLDAACLWVFIAAFGKLVSPIDLMVAYGIANVLAVIPITPSGLGVIESVLIPTLVGFGVPSSKAIVAVLGYRLVNFWLPIPVGGISYLSLRFGPRLRRTLHLGPRVSGPFTATTGAGSAPDGPTVDTAGTAGTGGTGGAVEPDESVGTGGAVEPDESVGTGGAAATDESGGSDGPGEPGGADGAGGAGDRAMAPGRRPEGTGSSS